MTSFIKRGISTRSDDTMDDDGDDKDDTKRKSRNLSEKKRRDQFNMLINELSSMVSTNNRKMDKSTVLKSTISFLKNHNEIAVRSRAHEIQEDWKPSFLSNEEFTHLILEALDGFIMVFSSSGRIFYASESITSLLGHLPSDLMNMTIYDMVYEEDQSELYNLLVNPNSSIDTVQYNDNKEGQISFTCHMRRGGLDLRDEITYELVQFVGYFRSDVDPLEVDNLISTSGRFNNLSEEIDTRLIFVGTGRLQTPLLIREMSVVDSTKSEFTSRHSLEWKFLFLDHRAPPIIGYLPFEVLGTSGYDYYHVDDLDKVVTCHEALMQKGEGTSCHYRFLTKGQQWIWLQTRFYITYHQWNSKPEFIVCTHRVVSYVDVMKQMRKNSEAGTQNHETDAVRCTNLSNKEIAPAVSQSGVASSQWSSKSSVVKPSRFTTPDVNSPPPAKQRSHAAPPPPGSDSNSMSADSPVSRQSQLSVQANRPHSSAGAVQIINKPLLTVAPSQQITPSFLEPQQQYVAAIPVQPVLATAGFPGTAVVTSMPTPDVGLVRQPIVMTNSQTHIQEQLQRKHEELQQLIVQQQEELRRVSEQLLMARYGLLPSLHLNVNSIAGRQGNPSIMNVTLPYSAAGATVSSTTATIGHEGSGTVSSDLFQSPLTMATVATRPHGHASIMIEPHQVNLQTHPSDEVIPFQLSQQQAQLLFSAPNSTQHHQ